MYQRGDTLRVFGVGESFEEAVGGVQNRKSHLGPVDEGGETFVMAFAGFAEEHGLNAASRTHRFLHHPDTPPPHQPPFPRHPPPTPPATPLPPPNLPARK